MENRQDGRYSLGQRPLGVSIWILCLLIILDICHASHLQCYMGRVSSLRSDTVRTVSCETPAIKRPITSCLTFKYQLNEDEKTQSDSLRFGGVGVIDFKCDLDHVCDGERTGGSFGMRNVTLKGLSGEAFCCNTSHCNEPELFPLPRTNVPCFVGLTRQGTTHGAMQPCTTSHCYNMSSDGGTKHGCDVKSLCIKRNLIDKCKQITDDMGHPRHLCCCRRAGCNVDASSQVTLHRSAPVAPPGGSPQHQGVTPARMVPMPAGLLPGSQQLHRRKSRVAGIVSGSVMGIALVAMIVVVAVRQWRKYQQKRDFSFVQLTADVMVI